MGLFDDMYADLSEELVAIGQVCCLAPQQRCMGEQARKMV